VTNLAFANKDVLWISWKHSAEELGPNLRHTNEVTTLRSPLVPGFICIAISTAWARQLSIAIQIVIYIKPKDEPNHFETEDKLGDMTSELRTKRYVSELVSGALKNYAYKVIETVRSRAAIVCKFRGITLNYNAKHLVNFDVIRDMIRGKGYIQ